jgi:hypothetical protein
MYRLEVSAPTGQATTIFLHAFYLCPSAEAEEMPGVELLPDDDQHAKLSLAGGEHVLRFPLDGAAGWQWVKGGTRKNSR